MKVSTEALCNKAQRVQRAAQGSWLPWMARLENHRVPATEPNHSQPLRCLLGEMQTDLVELVVPLVPQPVLQPSSLLSFCPQKQHDNEDTRKRPFAPFLPVNPAITQMKHWICNITSRGWSKAIWLTAVDGSSALALWLTAIDGSSAVWLTAIRWI